MTERMSERASQTTAYYFEHPDDTGLIVLWKKGRCNEVAVFDLAEAIRLQETLTEAIEGARRLSTDGVSNE